MRRKLDAGSQCVDNRQCEATLATACTVAALLRQCCQTRKLAAASTELASRARKQPVHQIRLRTLHRFVLHAASGIRIASMRPEEGTRVYVLQRHCLPLFGLQKEPLLRRNCPKHQPTVYQVWYDGQRRPLCCVRYRLHG